MGCVCTPRLSNAEWVTECGARIFLTIAVAFVLAVDCFAAIFESGYIVAFNFTIQSRKLKD